MAQIELYDYQKKALAKLKSGSILDGKVGSGKTLTALAWFKQNFVKSYLEDNRTHTEIHQPLYIITTAKKRDTGDWEREAELLGLFKPVVDSWNNVEKYTDVKDAVFFFDEQRFVGYGKCSKYFIKFAKANSWLFLTAPPGNIWSDYI